MVDTTASAGLTVQQWDSNYYTEALNEHIFKPIYDKYVDNYVNK